MRQSWSSAEDRRRHRTQWEDLIELAFCTCSHNRLFSDLRVPRSRSISSCSLGNSFYLTNVAATNVRRADQRAQ